MRKIIYLFLIIVFIFSENLYSIDTVSVKYCPLRIGDRLVYRVDSYGGSGGISWRDSSIFYSEVTSTIVYNGKVYYYYDSFLGLGSYSLRYDSTSGKLLTYTGADSCSGELTYFKLSALKGENNGPCSIRNFYCNDTGLVTLFSQQHKFKSFSMMIDPYTSRTIKFAADIGCYRFEQDAQHPTSYNHLVRNLKGAVINGIVYGDTSLRFPTVGIKSISDFIPWKYCLMQNYPNPFNPSTKIKFDIPNQSEVKIVVYDLLGREVSTLVNEQLKPGTYEVEWPAPSGDGSNFSSGVYYYKLIAGDYTETRKMVLVK